MSTLFSLSRLDWTIYVSWLGTIAVLLVPAERKETIRWIALASAALGLLVSFVGFVRYDAVDPTTQDALRASFRQFEVSLPWIPALGASYHLGADGISLPLLLLTGLVAVTGVLFSWNIEHRTKEFFAFLLVLVSGVYGVFLSLDVFLLFAFYELAIIPKYFMIAIWGSTRKEFASMQLVLYSFIGSALVFVGILAIYVAAGATTFDLFALQQAKLSVDFQFWCFPLVFIGFGVLAGMWPFHTWAPTGHAAAPTAASMLLAGVVMKLGAYGCLRVAMLLLPQGMIAHGHFWQWVIAMLAVVGIVYGAGVALVQKDFKFVIGYSSVSHMGFVLLGLATLNTVGVDGGVLQMFSHGIVAALLFAVVGRIVYERAHTRELDKLSTMKLVKQMPVAAVLFVIAGLASMGLPGFSGFVAELQVLVGAWERFPWIVIASGAGIVLAVWYTFRTLHMAFFGEPGAPAAPDDHAHPLDPITWQEKLAAGILVVVLVVVGLHPRLLLDMIDASVQIMIQGLPRG
jgi:NADH-quinone oxidoreductase subunit M